MIYHATAVTGKTTDCQVLGDLRIAKADGNNEHAVLHNMTATLSLVASILCLVSAWSTSLRRTRVMAQSMTFQALVGPGLVLCGVLLFESSISFAAGRVNDFYP